MWERVKTLVLMSIVGVVMVFKVEAVLVSTNE